MATSPSLITGAVGWRREFRAVPELGCQEQGTSHHVTELLASFGLQVHHGPAGTDAVTTLEDGPGPVIGLRVDMNALPITGLGSISYRSCRPEMMHTHSHDDHTTILLAAVARLAQTRQFSGTICFVFQPTEGNLGGARKMVEEGLFERSPMDAIYTLHNQPGIPLGEVALGDDAVMAPLDAFKITLRGKSCRTAMPGSGADPVVAATRLVMALQTVPSCRLSLQDSTVVSTTQINDDEAVNVLPNTVVLRGTFRYLGDHVYVRVRELIGSYVVTWSRVPDMQGGINWFPGYPVARGHVLRAQRVRGVAVTTLDVEAVRWNQTSSMTSEDFTRMPEACSGAHSWIGTNGETPLESLHNTSYNFNDALTSLGATMRMAPAEKQLPAA